MGAVLNVGRDDTIQRDGQLRAPGVDLVDVPLAAGLGHGVHHRDVDNATRAIARVGARVPDVHLVGADGAYLVGIAGADEDAAVGIAFAVELRIDVEVLVGFLGDEIPALALVGHDGAALRAPVGVALSHEVVKAGLPVDQRLPSLSGQSVHAAGSCQRSYQQPHNHYGPVFHGYLPPTC